MKLKYKLRDKLADIGESILIVLFMWGIAFAGLSEVIGVEKAIVWATVLILLIFIAIYAYKVPSYDKK